MITTRHLLYFVATAEQGGTAAAARTLNVSQPTVSVTVRELEALLGGQLFIRNPPKGLAITAFGQRKLGQARRLLSGVRAFEVEGRAGAGPSGSVSLGYFTTLGPSHLPGLLRKAKSALPDIELELVEGDLETLYVMLERSQIELALTYDVGLTGAVSKHQVAALPPYALLPAGHPLAETQDVSLAGLAAYPFVLFDLPHSREFLLSTFWHQGHEPKVCYRSGSLEMVRGMVANGLGVSLLITRPHYDHAYDGKAVVCRPLAEKTAQQKLIVAHSSKATLTEPTAAVLRFLQQWFAEQTIPPAAPVIGLERSASTPS
jgi:DNA-binding transcriptional LysR family regulator|tara:strand:- start:1768 stop:2718 length:951 start_codon:yes stop_codon:yes gene_type:complete